MEMAASKQGYKTITKKTQFGVIEKEAEIRDAVFDKRKETDRELSKLKIFAIIISLVIFAGIFLIFRIKKKT